MQMLIILMFCDRLTCSYKNFSIKCVKKDEKRYMYRTYCIGMTWIHLKIHLNAKLQV